MTSHKQLGGLKLSVSAPFRFTKKKSRYNKCIGNLMIGYGGGMANRADIRAKFIKSVGECKVGGKGKYVKHQGLK